MNRLHLFIRVMLYAILLWLGYCLHLSGERIAALEQRLEDRPVIEDSSRVQRYHSAVML